jgi:hypothetical protein
MKTSYAFLFGFTFFLFTTFCSYGQTIIQDNNRTIQVNKVITSASLNYLGISIYQERRVGSSITFLYGAGLHYSFYLTKFPIGGTRFINVIDPYFGQDYNTKGFTPYVMGEIRVYHTLFNRFKKDKNIQYNSASYIALFGEAPLTSHSLINVPNLSIASPIGLKYGIRRNLGQHFYLDGSVGVANKISRSQNSFLPRLDAGITWHL